MFYQLRDFHSSRNIFNMDSWDLTGRMQFGERRPRYPSVFYNPRWNQNMNQNQYNGQWSRGQGIPVWQTNPCWQDQSGNREGREQYDRPSNHSRPTSNAYRPNYTGQAQNNYFPNNFASNNDSRNNGSRERGDYNRSYNQDRQNFGRLCAEDAAPNYSRGRQSTWRNQTRRSNAPTQSSYRRNFFSEPSVFPSPKNRAYRGRPNDLDTSELVKEPLGKKSPACSAECHPATSEDRITLIKTCPSDDLILSPLRSVVPEQCHGHGEKVLKIPREPSRNDDGNHLQLNTCVTKTVTEEISQSETKNDIIGEINNISLQDEIKDMVHSVAHSIIKTPPTVLNGSGDKFGGLIVALQKGIDSILKSSIADPEIMVHSNQSSNDNMSSVQNSQQRSSPKGDVHKMNSAIGNAGVGSLLKSTHNVALKSVTVAEGQCEGIRKLKPPTPAKSSVGQGNSETVVSASSRRRGSSRSKEVPTRTAKKTKEDFFQSSILQEGTVDLLKKLKKRKETMLNQKSISHDRDEEIPQGLKSVKQVRTTKPNASKYSQSKAQTMKKAKSINDNQNLKRSSAGENEEQPAEKRNCTYNKSKNKLNNEKPSDALLMLNCEVIQSKSCNKPMLEVKSADAGGKVNKRVLSKGSLSKRVEKRLDFEDKMACTLLLKRKRKSIDHENKEVPVKSANVEQHEFSTSSRVDTLEATDVLINDRVLRSQVGKTTACDSEVENRIITDTLGFEIFTEKSYLPKVAQENSVSPHTSPENTSMNNHSPINGPIPNEMLPVPKATRARDSKSFLSVAHPSKPDILEYKNRPKTDPKVTESCNADKTSKPCTPDKKTESCNADKTTKPCTPDKKTESCTPDKKTELWTPDQKNELCTPDKKTESYTADKKTASCNGDKKTQSGTPDKKTASCTTDKRQTVDVSALNQSSIEDSELSLSVIAKKRLSVSEDTRITTPPNEEKRSASTKLAACNETLLDSNQSRKSYCRRESAARKPLESYYVRYGDFKELIGKYNITPKSPTLADTQTETVAENPSCNPSSISIPAIETPIQSDMSTQPDDAQAKCNEGNITESLSFSERSSESEDASSPEETSHTTLGAMSAHLVPSATFGANVVLSSSETLDWKVHKIDIPPYVFSWKTLLFKLRKLRTLKHTEFETVETNEIEQSEKLDKTDDTREGFEIQNDTWQCMLGQNTPELEMQNEVANRVCSGDEIQPTSEHRVYYEKIIESTEGRSCQETISPLSPKKIITKNQKQLLCQPNVKSGMKRKNIEDTGTAVISDNINQFLNTLNSSSLPEPIPGKVMKSNDNKERTLQTDDCRSDKLRQINLETDIDSTTCTSSTTEKGKFICNESVTSTNNKRTLTTETANEAKQLAAPTVAEYELFEKQSTIQIKNRMKSEVTENDHSAILPHSSVSNLEAIPNSYTNTTDPETSDIHIPIVPDSASELRSTLHTGCCAEDTNSCSDGHISSALHTLETTTSASDQRSPQTLPQTATRDNEDNLSLNCATLVEFDSPMSPNLVAESTECIPTNFHSLHDTDVECKLEKLTEGLYVITRTAELMPGRDPGPLINVMKPVLRKLIHELRGILWFRELYTKITVMSKFPSFQNRSLHMNNLERLLLTINPGDGTSNSQHNGYEPSSSTSLYEWISHKRNHFFLASPETMKSIESLLRATTQCNTPITEYDLLVVDIEHKAENSAEQLFNVTTTMDYLPDDDPICIISLMLPTLRHAMEELSYALLLREVYRKLNTLSLGRNKPALELKLVNRLLIMNSQNEAGFGQFHNSTVRGISNQSGVNHEVTSQVNTQYDTPTFLPMGRYARLAPLSITTSVISTNLSSLMHIDNTMGNYDDYTEFSAPYIYLESKYRKRGARVEDISGSTATTNQDGTSTQHVGHQGKTDHVADEPDSQLGFTSEQPFPSEHHLFRDPLSGSRREDTCAFTKQDEYSDPSNQQTPLDSGVREPSADENPDVDHCASPRLGVPSSDTHVEHDTNPPHAACEEVTSTCGATANESPTRHRGTPSPLQDACFSPVSDLQMLSPEKIDDFNSHTQSSERPVNNHSVPCSTSPSNRTSTRALPTNETEPSDPWTDAVVASAVSPVQYKPCVVCGKKSTIRSKCKTATYCGVDHYKHDWKNSNHKR